MYRTNINKKIKIISPNIEACSIILDSNGGLGLNLDNYEVIEFENNKKYDEIFDIFLVHGYDMHGQSNDKNKETIRCKKFVVDMMGEWVSIEEHPEYDRYIEENNIECEDKIICSLMDRKWNVDIKDYKVFESDFPATFFTSYHNNTFHRPLHMRNTAKVGDVNLTGTLPLDKPKPKLFQCLNNIMREHRIFMVTALEEHGLLDVGLVSSNSAEWITEDENEKKIKCKEYNVDSVLDSDSSTGDGIRYSLHPGISDQCYIDLVTESEYGSDNFFITEKPHKSFLSLQFPLIFGYPGIIQYFRDYGFDMFDDIIDHSYDLVKTELNDYDNLAKKSDIIAKELKRLSTLDFYKIYQENIDRLIKNQNLINTYMEKNDIRMKELAEFLFEDNFVSITPDSLEEVSEEIGM